MSSLASSPPGSPSSSNSQVILTPGAKVRALLAQFDSDSEKETASTVQPEKSKNSEALLPPPARRSNAEKSRSASDDDDEEDDDLPVAPRGRMAARMQSLNHGTENRVSSENEDASDAYTRIRKQLLRPDPEDEDGEGQETDGASQSPEVSRKRLLKRKSSTAAVPEPAPARARSISPLFFPSPSPSKRARTSRMTPDVQASSGSEDLSHDDNRRKKPNPRFMALVQKQRQKRLEQEAADAKKKAERLEQLRDQGLDGRQRGTSPADFSEEDSGSNDDGAGRKRTQQARPTRKATKKALEEMHRETQRMSRNMQLAHQAQTKKKITKESLFARFNFPMPGAPKEQPSSATASSAPNSDGEGIQSHTTPPTSPLREEVAEKPSTIHEAPTVETTEVPTIQEAESDLPTLEDIMTQPELFELPLDKGKGKSIEGGKSDRPTSVPLLKEKVAPRAFRVRLSAQDVKTYAGGLSDDDLEIVTSQSPRRKIAVFEKIPKKKAHETASHLMLRSLAQMNSDVKRGDKKRSSMTAAQMEVALRKQARLQAAKERAEKIEELKAKGIFVQTAEDRNKEQQEIEDLVERAREEAADIQRRETVKAKKNGTYVDDGLDDEDDDDYEGDEELPISGSEEEGEDGDGEEEDEEEDSGDESEGELAIATEGDNFVDEEASEIDSEDEHNDDMQRSDIAEEDDGLGEAEDVPTTKISRTRRLQRAIVDSDDEDAEPMDDHMDDNEGLVDSPYLNTPRGESTLQSPAVATKTPRTINHSAKKIIPGLPLSDDMPIGLTQAFAATMADSQSQEDSMVEEQDSLAMMRDLPEPQLVGPSLQRLDSVDMVSDSQPASQTQPLGLNLNLTQGGPSQRVAQSPVIGGTQFTELPEPTQDAGYVLSPFDEKRFDTPVVPHSTIDTVILSRDESPLVQRNGRLRRGFELSKAALSDDETSEVSSITQAASAFEKMRQAARRKAQKDAFDKTRSNAKEAVDDAAEESEDEYAGLGGASDDEAGEENEEDRKMINDENNEKVNERELAALLANKERAEDSAAVSKLLQDITTGRLRRKRGAGGFDDLDLSDEESTHARRREAKRREFAKMRRELLVNSDERIGKIAQDPKKNAFLHAIEDRDDEEEVDLDLEYHESNEESQSQSQTVEAVQQDPSPELQVVSQKDKQSRELVNKQPLEPTGPDTLNRASTGTNSRRKGMPGRRPQTLAEIRDSVSFLIEDPVDARAPVSDSESDTEAQENLDQKDADAFADELDGVDVDDDDDMDDFIVQDEEPTVEKSIFKKPGMPASRAPFTERRTKPRGPVVDRLSLMRQSSSSTSASSGSGKMAFFTSSAGSGSSFKVPSLLRRATTNSSLNSDTSISATGVTTKTERGAAGSEKEMIRKGTGGQKSSVGYYQNSRVQQREEQMRRRLTGKGRDETGKSARSKFGSGGLLGSLVKKDSWE